MKMISWNVAGFRSALKKGFEDFFRASDADVYCLQESKAEADQFDFRPEGYEMYLNPAEKKGYSGTLIFTRVKPLSVTFGLGIEEHDHEGRVITLEFEDFYLVNEYAPNAQQDLSRIPYRMVWEDEIRAYLKRLEEKKPVVMCGDLNVAHEEIDLKNPKSNRHNAGFTDEERGKFTELLAAGFTDTFRYLHPDEVKYSWWSFRGNARANNTGWRIDYFVVSDSLRERLKAAVILNEVYGSDHCPVGLVLE